MPVTIIKELTDSRFQGDACLVQRGEEYFVVSSVVAHMTGFETLVFPSDAEGNVTDRGEVAGGRGVSREEAIAQLDENGPERREHDLADGIEALMEISEQLQRRP